MYAAAASILLDCDIEYIGILSLLKSDLVLVPINKDIQEELIVMFNKIIDKTLANDFVKHFPDTKYSACLNSFGGPCPFLKECWPKSHDYLNRFNMSDDYLNNSFNI